MAAYSDGVDEARTAIHREKERRARGVPANKHNSRNNLRFYLPLDEGEEMAYCCLERHRGEKVTAFHLHREDTGAFILACSCASDMEGPFKFHTLTDSHLRTMDAIPAAADSAVYLGMMDINFIGTEFVVRDHRWDDAMSARFSHELGLTVYETNVSGRAPNSMKVVVCVELKSSTRLQCARMRRFRRELFGCASRTRRERSIRPKISRIDFEVWWGPPKPVISGRRAPAPRGPGHGGELAGHVPLRALRQGEHDARPREPPQALVPADGAVRRRAPRIRGRRAAPHRRVDADGRRPEPVLLQREEGRRRGRRGHAGVLRARGRRDARHDHLPHEEAGSCDGVDAFLYARTPRRRRRSGTTSSTRGR